MRGPKINTHRCIHLMLGKDTKKHTLEKRASLTIGTGKKKNKYMCKIMKLDCLSSRIKRNFKYIKDINERTGMINL